jgi:nicotinamidase-related amidase
MNPGLLLVDIQNDYFAGGRMQLEGISDAGRRAGDLLNFFRDRQWPTFHIQHVSTSDDAPFFRPNTDGVELHQSIAPLPGEVVVLKNFPNSFRETSLHAELQKHELSSVVICGAMSHMCVDATTRAAFDFGFECEVIHDACATCNLAFGGAVIPAREVHGAFMAALGMAYARVLTWDEYRKTIG